MSDVYKDNYDLREEVKILRAAFSEIRLRLVCVGGPFNDNSNGFNKEQLKELRPILNLSEEFSGEKGE